MLDLLMKKKIAYLFNFGSHMVHNLQMLNVALIHIFINNRIFSVYMTSLSKSSVQSVGLLLNSLDTHIQYAH